MGHNKNEVNTDVIAMSASVSAAIAMQTSAHSVGLMFEQSILNQQNHFQLALSSSVVGFKKMSTKKINHKLIKGLKKSRFDI